MLLKYVFDRFLAFVGILVLSPVYLFIIICIRFKMPDGPVFFPQKRIGLNGRLFIMYKFRTMIMNHIGSSITVAGEERITTFGAFLRKYKLDELPELWNILKAEMSFVGPRPDIPGYADQLIGDDTIILSFRPGLTGPASLKYRNEEEELSHVQNPIKYNNEIIYPDKVRINKLYIENWSFWLDIKIIAVTILSKKYSDLLL